jgi:altronate hydrolase
MRTDTPQQGGLLVLHAGDDVAVATRDLRAGEAFLVDGRAVTTCGDVPRGHKVALTDVPAGAEVHKYGQVIGRATAPIPTGAHVHVHNLGFEEGSRDHQFGGVRAMLAVPEGPRPTFQGYRRADGRVGTRNYIAILTSVNCSASTAKMIAAQFTPQVLADYPGVDGVIALTHQSGCGLVPSSEGGRMLLRTLRGYAAHPNVAGLLVLGLGCEMVLTEQLTTRAGTGVFIGMPGVGTPPPVVDPVLADIPSDTLVESLTIQEAGGVRAAVAAGVAAVHRMLPVVGARERTECDVSELVLALNCGGSDGYSGITANPALGWASDRLVSYGATSALAETPEVFGAEHLLTRRATRPEVAQRLLERIEWWKAYTAAGGGAWTTTPRRATRGAD